MNYRLEVQFEAIVDMKRAYDWYENRRQGLGADLINEIEDCYTSICDKPERFGLVQGNIAYRRARVHRFPYIIVFVVAEDTVIVSRLKHIKQNITL